MIENLALRDLSRLTAWVSGAEITLRQVREGDSNPSDASRDL
jgi:hypothetical protein